ncbi:MAG TPA: aspartate 1-decarboxylase [Candidatus Nanoarchaeia archaeon]|nr:aspartate 1-decarboxylase [Candidatus Nanoarchaeia archaeon]
MMREVLHAKIWNATVTQAKVEYIGSISIDEDLIEKAGFWPGQKVLVVSNTTGERLETYVMRAERGSGIIGMNGAAARVIKVGEKIIIMGFMLSEKPIKEKVVIVDEKNAFLKFLM